MQKTSYPSVYILQIISNCPHNSFFSFHFRPRDFLPPYNNTNDVLIHVHLAYTPCSSVLHWCLKSTFWINLMNAIILVILCHGNFGLVLFLHREYRSLSPTTTTIIIMRGIINIDNLTFYLLSNQTCHLE